MIKIFSIKEIVDASEGLLKSQNQKIDRNLNLNNIQNKISNLSKSFDKPLVLEKELEITEKQMDIEIDYFSRKFDKKNLKNALMIYGKLIENGAKPRVAVHTWELYDAAFAWPSVRRYQEVQKLMDEI